MVASIYSTHDVIVWIRGIPRERMIEFLSGQRGGQPCASQHLYASFLKFVGFCVYLLFLYTLSVNH